MQRVSVIGFGDVFRGDHCVGLCVIEALAQEGLADMIRLAYEGHDPSGADLWLFDVELAVVVGAVHLGQPAGHVSCWDLGLFQQNLDWVTDSSRSVRSLAAALDRARLAGGFSEEVMFLWIEPKTEIGVGISKEGRKALRTAVQIIKDRFCERGILNLSRNVLPLYRLGVLRTVA